MEVRDASNPVNDRQLSESVIVLLVIFVKNWFIMQHVNHEIYITEDLLRGKKRERELSL